MSTTEKYPVLFVRDEKGNYVCVDERPEWIAKLKFVIDNGPSYASLLGPLLVRHGDPEVYCQHYPVPFIFKTEKERRVAAERRSLAPPQEGWVRRKLQLLYRLAGCESAMAA